MRKAILAAVASAFLGLTAVASSQEPLKVGVSAGPYGEILEFAAGIASKQGLTVKVIEFSDWNAINAALAQGDIDANNFQHIPYLNNQIKARGYNIVPLDKSVVVPIGLYSSKTADVKDVRQGGTISIPNDPTNGARALALLERAGLIKLRAGADLDATVADVTDNPKRLRFVELDAAQLPRSLTDVDASVVTLNYAVLAKLDPKKALVLEDDRSKWHLVWAARADRQNDERLKKFIAIYRSPEVRQFIEKRFDGTIIPTW